MFSFRNLFALSTIAEKSDLFGNIITIIVIPIFYILYCTYIIPNPNTIVIEYRYNSVHVRKNRMRVRICESRTDSYKIIILLQ